VSPFLEKLVQWMHADATIATDFYFYFITYGNRTSVSPALIFSSMSEHPFGFERDAFLLLAYVYSKPFKTGVWALSMAGSETCCWWRLVYVYLDNAKLMN